MPLLHASAERTIPAPAAAVYALLADYRDGHPRILPPAFSDLTVLQGGIGAGTDHSVRPQVRWTEAGDRGSRRGTGAWPRALRGLSRQRAP